MIKKLMRAVALAGLMFLAACSPKTEYTHALPKDASVVVALDLDEMAQKSGLVSTEGQTVVNKLKGFLKGGLQGDAAQLAERIIDNPSESGLALEEKVYMFATPHAQAFAILAKVADESKVESMLEMLQKESIATSLKEEAECRWAKIGSAICGFNNGTFLILQPMKGDADGMKGTLFSWMRQQEGEGYAALPEFDRLKEDGNDIASTLNLTVVPYELTTTLRMGLSADIRLEDIKYLLTANFEQGKVVVRSESLIQNARIQGFFDAMNEVTQPIQGKLLDCYQGNTMLWAGGHIQGKELYNMLCQNPAIKRMLDNPLLPVDVEYIFSSIDGDFAIGNASLLTGQYLLYADVTNNEFLRTFEDLRPLLALTGGQITLDKLGESEYLMRTFYGNFWFGVKNKRLYVTNNPTWAEEAGRTYGASLAVKPWAVEVKDNRLFASANLAILGEMMNNYRYSPTGNKQTDMALRMLMNHLEYINVGMSDWRNGEMELVLKDKNTNLLSLIVKMLEQI